MTDIQIKYWDYKEGARHNRVVESETYRHDSATELQAAKELLETRRSHKENEKIGWYNAKETKRSHKVNEHIATAQANASMIQAQSSMISAKASATNAETNRIKAESDINLNQLKGELVKRQMSTEDTKIALNLANAMKAKSEGQLTKAKAYMATIEAYMKKHNYKWNSMEDKYGWIIGSKAAGSAITAGFGSLAKLI